MKTILMMTTIALCAGCASSEWSKNDTRREIAFQVLNAADAYTTSRIQHHPEVMEGGVLTRKVLGVNPSTESTLLYFATRGLSHWGISRIMPSWLRPYWQGVNIADEVSVIINNCGDGLCR